jgi:hypothetical protein
MNDRMAQSASHCEITDQRDGFSLRVEKQRVQDQQFLPVRGYFVAQMHDSQILV